MTPEKKDRRRVRAAAWAKANPDKVRAKSARYHASHPEVFRNRRLRRNFGITLAEYEHMIVAQNGVCAICRKPCKTGRRLAVDHDHDTGKVRGLLCAGCNIGIGQMNEDPMRLRVAADYLESGSLP